MFSVCYIAKNEEKNIKESLSKLTEYLGTPQTNGYEILVLDTGSTDKTVEVAESFGARIEYFEWIKDFSAARNAAMKKAKFDRILFLDADEIPEKINRDEILKLCKKYPDAIGRIERRNLCNDGKNGTCIMTDRVERFFDRRLYHYEGVIHEQVTKNDNGQMCGYPIPFTVYHEGYFGTKEQLKEKALRNNELLFAELDKHPDDPYIYYQIGQSFDLIGDYDKSLEYYGKGYLLNPDRNAEYSAILVCNYGNGLLKKGLCEEAKKLVENEIEYYDKYGDFLCFAGYLCTETHDLENAIKYYNMAYDAELIHIEGSRDAIPSYNLGCIYEALGDEIKARKYYEKAVEKKYGKAGDRLKQLLEDNFETKSIKKYVSVIIPVTNDTDIKAIWNDIKEQSIGVGHIEIVFIVMTEDKDIIDTVIHAEKEYEASVCLLYPDDKNDLLCNIGIAFGYTSADYVMIVKDNVNYKWDALRMMYRAMITTNADMVTYGINYSDSDFVLSIENEQMRENVKRAGILKSVPICSLYKTLFLTEKGVTIENLINSSAGQLFAEKIYCIKENLGMEI